MIPLIVVLCFPLLLAIGYGALYVLIRRDPRIFLGPVGFFFYLALLTIPLGVVVATHPDLPARALTWHDTTPAWLAVGVAAGFALWWVQRALPGKIPNAGERIWTGPPGRAGFVLLMLPVAYIVLAEELVWRGFLLPALGGPVIGLPLSAAAFALHHYHFGLRHVGFSFLAGLALGGLYLLAGTLWPPIASHLLYNALAWRWMRRAPPGATP